LRGGFLSLSVFHKGFHFGIPESPFRNTGLAGVVGNLGDQNRISNEKS